MAVMFALALPCVVSAQYPKTLTLTVTRVTRMAKTDPETNTFITELKVEAHTATANLVLECESRESAPPGAQLNCADIEIGSYEARRLSPSVVSLWPKDAVGDDKHHLLLYAITLEEVRTK